MNESFVGTYQIIENVYNPYYKNFEKSTVKVGTTCEYILNLIIF